MADVVVTLKIMPNSPDVDLSKLETEALDKIKAFTGLDNYKVEQEPVAFGLKALKILFVMDESNGATDDLEDQVKKIDGVNSVDVVDVRRTIG